MTGLSHSIAALTHSIAALLCSITSQNHSIATLSRSIVTLVHSMNYYIESIYDLNTLAQGLNPALRYSNSALENLTPSIVLLFYFFIIYFQKMLYLSF